MWSAVEWQALLNRPRVCMSWAPLPVQNTGAAHAPAKERRQQKKHSPALKPPHFQTAELQMSAVYVRIFMDLKFNNIRSMPDTEEENH